MTTRSYRGDALAVAKQVLISKPQSYQAGKITIKINNKVISTPSWDAEELVELWNFSGFPETAAITATIVTGNTTGQYGETQDGILLTSNIPGEDFFVSVYIGDDSDSDVTNEVQRLTFLPAPSGGTFTLTFNGQTTGAITFIEGNTGGTATNIQTALVALSNIAPGDVVVTYDGDGVYLITFGGAYATLNVSQITADGTNLEGGNVTATVLTVVNGSLPVDEVQTLSLPNSPTGGTFTLTYAGQTTAAIAYNANAATVQAALEALSNIAVGDVVCSGGALPGTPVVITFASALADQNVVLITGNGASLTGGTNNIANITTVRGGSAGTNAKNRMRATSTSDTFRWAVSVGSGASRRFEYSSTFLASAGNTAIKDALVGMTMGYDINAPIGQYEDYVIQSGDLSITGDFTNVSPSGGGILVEFTGNLAARFIGSYTNSTVNLATDNLSAIPYAIYPLIFIVNQSNIGFGNVNNIADGSVGVSGLPPVSVDAVELCETQTYQVLDNTLDGEYTLTVYDDGGSPHNTTPIPYSETDPAAIAAYISAALGGSYVTVDVSTSGTISTVTFRYRNYGYTDNNITILSSSEGAVSVETTTQGFAGVRENQTIELDGNEFPVRGGTFTLTYAGETTTDIAWDATAEIIKAALEALTAVAADDIQVSGSLVSGLSFLFKVTLGNVDTLIINTDELINATVEADTFISGGLEFYFEEITRNAGPECFDDPTNYDPPGLPSHDDTINFEYGASACRWGLKQRDTYVVVDTTLDTLQLSSKRPLFQNGQRLLITTSSAAPGGLSAGTAYYIINMDSRGRFQLSTTLGGTPINITSAGTGTQTIGLRLAEFQKPARYSLDIGLSRVNSNGFIEYRPRYLEAYCTAAVLGKGEGSDSSLVRIDTGDQATGFTVYSSGSAGENNVPAISLLTNHATSDIIAYGGDIGLAAHLDEVSVIRDITLYDAQLISVGGTTCRNITGDENSNIRGKFTASGTINLGV